MGVASEVKHLPSPGLSAASEHFGPMHACMHAQDRRCDHIGAMHACMHRTTAMTMPGPCMHRRLRTSAVTMLGPCTHAGTGPPI